MVARSANSPSGFINPLIAELYTTRKWQLDEGLRRIFKAANITMSVRLEGRCRKTVIASFHSLRHTFVSLSANAGVPLPVVQSIVGHCSSAMTRHYYHENEAVLRQAVAAIPAIGERDENASSVGASVPLARMATDTREGRSLLRPNTPQNAPSDLREGRVPTRPHSIAMRLKRLSQLLAKGLISAEEHAATRARILAEI